MREFIAKEDQITVPIAERLIRCKDCKRWVTGIAYETTGRCKHPNMPEGLITNKNFFCAYGQDRTN